MQPRTRLPAFPPSRLAGLLIAFTLAIPALAAPPTPTIEVRHSDVTGDGVPDTGVFITTRLAGLETRYIRVYSGVDGRFLYSVSRAAPRSPDLTGDGVVNADDLAMLLGAMQAQTTGPAMPDLTGDGVVDTRDLAILLDSFNQQTHSDLLEPNCGPNGIPCSDGTCRSDCTGGGDGLTILPPPDDGFGAGGGPRGGGGDDGGGIDPPPPTDGSCSVTIDPLPGKPTLRCVGVWTPDDTDNDNTNDTANLPTIKATGSDPNGTYAWQVIQGAGKVELYDADTDTPAATPTSQNVRIRGLVPSAALDDVQIKVTHTTADGSCSKSDMIPLTVILATLTFRPANPNAQPPGVWSNDNDITPQQNTGEPQLGRVTPTSPFGTTGFFENIEIEAIIQPCIASLASNLQYTQDKQGWAVVGNPNGTFTTNFLVSCPPGAHADQWCDDSPLFDAQDLNIEIAEGCRLYMVDRPGVSVNQGDCGSSSEGSRLMLCMRFRSWLEAEGFRVSDSELWRSSTEITCSFGFWTMTNTVYGNSLSNDLGAVCTNPDPFIPFAGLAVENTFDVHGFILSITNGNESTRTLSYMKALRKLHIGSIDEPTRKHLITALLQLARVDRKNYPASSPTELAIRMLGELRSPEAVGVLLDQIDKQFFPRIVVRRGDELPPSVHSLSLIGMPAVGPIIERAGIATVGQWRLMQVALRDIDRQKGLVRQTMRTMLAAQRAMPAPANAAETTQRALVKRRLEKFLATPEPRRPKPGPISLDQTAPQAAPVSASPAPSASP